MSKRPYWRLDQTDTSASEALQVVRVFVEPVTEHLEGQQQRLARILSAAVRRAEIQKRKSSGGEESAIFSMSVVC